MRKKQSNGADLGGGGTRMHKWSCCTLPCDRCTSVIVWYFILVLNYTHLQEMIFRIS